MSRIRRYRADLTQKIWIEELLCFEADSLPEEIRRIDLPEVAQEVERNRLWRGWNRRRDDRVSGGY